MSAVTCVDLPKGWDWTESTLHEWSITYLLPGWQGSRGATAELAVAKALELKVMC